MIERIYYLEKIDKAFNQVPIVVLLGARQVGKSSLMECYGAKKKHVLLIGQNPETADLFQSFAVIETWLRHYLDPDLDGLLLLDELQYIPGISTMLKLLVDKHRKLRVLCSGSSSLDILRNMEESLAGRIRIIETLSLSFGEYLLFRDAPLAGIWRSLDLNTASSALTAPLERLLNEYLVFGGLPRAALADSREEKAEILNDIYQTYLLQDVRNYINGSDTIGFNRMLRMLASQTGNLLNVNELSRECGLPYRDCGEYLALLEQMGIIRLLEPFFTNRRKVIAKMKKIYFCDLGLRNFIEKNLNDIEPRQDRGAVFENFVMLELWRGAGPGGELRFFRTADGTEVDFVLTRLTGRTAVECKFKVLEKPVSLAAYKRFCDNEGIGGRYVVNRNLNVNADGVAYVQGFLAGKI